MKLSNLIVLSLTSIVALSASAVETTVQPTPAQKAARREAGRIRVLKRTGGRIEKPNSQRGCMVVLDAQKATMTTNIQAFVERMERFMMMGLRYERVDPSEVAGGDWTALMRKRGASAIVTIVYDDTTPAVLAAPFENWAVVNVKKAEKNLNEAGKARFLGPRAAKMVAKAMAMLPGSLSQFPASPATALTIGELDESGDMLPIDQIEHIMRDLQKQGVTRKIVTTYRTACQDGWAPPPTNEYQKAIWDKVHELPTKPIKILPETKKVTE